tara:strand:+ start:291 stop:602 length:312 start_codon:yes stop_codon:yes gene_type:complete
MNSNNLGGMAADSTPNLATLSKADLLAMLEAKQREDAERERLAGITLELVEGISKAGKAFRVLQVKGGDLGWRGINLKPAMWRRLQALAPDITAAMAHHFPGE